MLKIKSLFKTGVFLLIANIYIYYAMLYNTLDKHTIISLIFAIFNITFAAIVGWIGSEYITKIVYKEVDSK
ncbi:hypothetical protein [Enterobacter pseudoroggenkampii]|uniref:hypothetical protein n=1 Tax=Enterobacter pseudoroggenkampii TaxID=2996112 RepID=UPI002263D41B|nr:hypothetical protein [Enterobacter pseudoroggenkampii]MCX8289103.1 hypothetical protein [Enterobacter pseudoroggenkampii]